jgi:hypothetical protein
MRLTVDRSLTRQLLEHLGGTSKSVTRLTDGDVQNELLNLELPHGVLSLLGGHGCGISRRAIEVVVDRWSWGCGG